MKRDFAGALGCVRVIVVGDGLAEGLLPFERALHSDGVFLSDGTPSRTNAAEVSRLAVPPRSRGSRSTGTTTVALALGAASMVAGSHCHGAFMVVTPSLARMLGSVGLALRQVAPAIDHYGVRAPYYCSSDEVLASPIARLVAAARDDLAAGRHRPAVAAVGAATR